VYNSTLLLESKTDLTKVNFSDFQHIEVGNNFILYDLTTQSYLKKRVDIVEYSYEMLNIHTLDVEPQDAFLTAEENVDNPRYMILQHNVGSCTAYCCTSPQYSGIYECLNNGSNGYCYGTYSYEYCASNPPSSGCFQCAPGCADCAGGGAKQ